LMMITLRRMGVEVGLSLDERLEHPLRDGS
jgi:hypothetical protein